MKRFLIALLVFSFVFAGKVWAQSRVDNFQPLQSEGDFPADFSNTMQQKTSFEQGESFKNSIVGILLCLFGFVPVVHQFQSGSVVFGGVAVHVLAASDFYA